MYLARYPPKREIAEAQLSRYARMTSRSSSGSSWVESAVEPTRSQNMTVNCRRSASGAAGRDLAALGEAVERRAFLALVTSLRLRRLAGSGVAAAPKVMPHWPQNLAVERTCWPQLGQTRTSVVPHSSQNLACSGFSNPQLPQRIWPFYSFGASRTRKPPRPERSSGNFLTRDWCSAQAIHVLATGVDGRR